MFAIQHLARHRLHVASIKRVAIDKHVNRGLPDNDLTDRSRWPLHFGYCGQGAITFGSISYRPFGSFGNGPKLAPSRADAAIDNLVSLCEIAVSAKEG